MLKSAEEWANANRPFTLASVFLVTIFIAFLVDWIFGGHLYNLIFYPELSTVAGARAWGSAIYAGFFILGIPTAFLLWLWRDRNVRDQLLEKKNEVENQRLELDVLKNQVEVQGYQIDHQARQLELQTEQIENQRKDISLKEFQEVRKIAAGLFEIDGTESAKTQLQIAAMHQLRGCLQQEYPETFRRAAFELLLAGHTAAVSDHIDQSVLQQSSRNNIRDLFSGRASTVAKERAKILRDDAKLLFSLKFSLQGRKFDFIDFSSMSADKLNFSGASFVGCQMRRINISSSDLSNVTFDGSDMTEANLDSTRLFDASLSKVYLSKAILDNSTAGWAKFDNSFLRDSSLRGCNFNFSSFKKSDLRDAVLSGSDFSYADFSGADLSSVTIDEKTSFENTIFDNQTSFAKDWEKLAENAKADYRSQWRDRGMRHVDDRRASNDLDDDIPF